MPFIRPTPSSAAPLMTTHTEDIGDDHLELSMPTTQWAKRSKPTISPRAWLGHLLFFMISISASTFVANSKTSQGSAATCVKPQLSLAALDHSGLQPELPHTHQHDHEHEHQHAGHQSAAKGVGQLPFELPVLNEDRGANSYRTTSESPSLFSTSDGEDSQYEFVRFVGNPDSWSAYKGPPSAAVDDAWNALWAANMVIPAEMYASTEPEFPYAGVATNASAAQGEGQYFATFEATHQLHCLYTLFRASYVDYYEPERKFLQHNPGKYHARLDHCTDMLRQKLMCDSDAGVATYNWVRGEDTPTSNYNVLHRCRKHQVLLDWSEKYAATGALFSRGDQTVQLEDAP